MLVQAQVLGILTAALLCVLLGSTVYAHSRAQALQQAHHSHVVSAQVVSAPVAGAVTSEVAQVRWTDTGGKTGQATAEVLADAHEGGQVQIWLDGAGKPVPAPASVEDSTGDGVLTGLLTAIGASTLVLALAALARNRLDRRDEQSWGRAWEVYEPLWTKRR
jgi:hypothetical protein